MHRVSLMQIKVHQLLGQGARDRKKRKELKGHLEQAKQIYNVAFEEVSR